VLLGKPMFSITAPERPRMSAAVAPPPAQPESALVAEPKAKKVRTPRAKTPRVPKPDDPTKPRTADIAKIVKYYLEHVRMHDKGEYVGIFRQVLLMCQKGITMAMISQAVQNYENDKFTQSCVPQRRHHIRKFMMPERIRQWASTVNTQASDKSLATLDRLTKEAIANNAPAPAMPTWKPEAEEEDECLSEL
jgi:hypothetical protein